MECFHSEMRRNARQRIPLTRGSDFTGSTDRFPVGNKPLVNFPTLKGLCPSRAEGIAGFALSPAGFPHLSLPNKLGSCKTALNGPPSRVGDPPSLAAALPLATPGLADRQGCSAALTLKGRR
jgi:hypothetical protein